MKKYSILQGGIIMSKKIAKSVAVGLSFALAVTNVNVPSETASAAAKKVKLSATKSVL